MPVLRAKPVLRKNGRERGREGKRRKEEEEGEKRRREEEEEERAPSAFYLLQLCAAVSPPAESVLLYRCERSEPQIMEPDDTVLCMIAVSPLPVKLLQ